MDKLKVILTGATGMVGEGVLRVCLEDPQVESVLVIGRKTCGVQHPNLTEILHRDFSDINPLRGRVTGYNTCFFCAGVSSVGMKQEEYYRLTYTLTLGFAGTLAEVNPGMTFCYVSGAYTDSSEKGRSAWARVKGKTENDLVKLPFKAVYNFRPAFMIPDRGSKNVPVFYPFVSWMFPVIKLFSPNSVCTLRTVGKAMIRAASEGYHQNILEMKDIKALG